MVAYGINLLLSAGAYLLLQWCLVRHHGKDSILANAVGQTRKGWCSLTCYLLGIVCAYLNLGRFAMGFFAAVAAMWLVPDKRIEQLLTQAHKESV